MASIYLFYLDWRARMKWFQISHCELVNLEALERIVINNETTESLDGKIKSIGIEILFYFKYDEINPAGNRMASMSATKEDIKELMGLLKQ